MIDPIKQFTYERSYVFYSPLNIGDWVFLVKPYDNMKRSKPIIKRRYVSAVNFGGGDHRHKLRTDENYVVLRKSPDDPGNSHIPMCSVGEILFKTIEDALEAYPTADTMYVKEWMRLGKESNERYK